MENSLAYARKNREKFLDELKELIRIPSISAISSHRPDLEKSALWLKEKLLTLKFEDVRILPTDGAPVVYAYKKSPLPAAPTMLVYGHYDVQPPDPLDLWKTAPFDPFIEGDYLVGRGSSDMKGQIMICLAAIESILQHEELPVNIKFLLEGEEEIGSPSLTAFVATNKDLLRSDFALNPDAGMISVGVPTITYALRGLLAFEIKVTGPGHDLHSGVFGGAILNPAIAISKIIASLIRDNGEIAIPGIYSSVKELSRKERDDLAKAGITDQVLLDQAKAPAVWGHEKYSAFERTVARPSLDVNGLYSGYIQEGAKTIIPSWAMAKITIRLVPDQDPEEIFELVKDYIFQQKPAGCTLEIKKMGSSPAIETDRNTPEVKAFVKAQEEEWGAPTYFNRLGGSIPVVALLKDQLGMDSVLCGTGLPDDLIHSPNEHLHIPTWEKGIYATIRFFDHLRKNNS